ncbi:MAG: hypothetical protein H0V19_05880 [Euzebyales bacterium]|nr:hypothetical protein [Euzebyales bacterium]
MRRRLLLAVMGLAAGLAIAGCAATTSAGESRQVLVDYVHDEVASSFISYFPKDVTVHPGDTVVFRQEWTGEAHSVTMGAMVDEMMAVVGPLIEKYGDSPEEPPRKVIKEYERAIAPLPEMIFFEADDFEVNQNAGQPCYLDSGRPPKDPDTPCDDADQEQPPFDGRQSYYNSGFIPYEGPQGNEFTVQLADDIEPGVYNYYCNLHGPFQAGTITVAEPDAAIPSQEEVSRQARTEIEAQAAPLVDAFDAAPREGEAKIYGMTVEPPLAGWGTEAPGPHSSINEFIPEAIEVEAGEPVTWTFVGGHTVSFKVPEYFAQIVVEDDGTVVYTEEAWQPVNSPAPPEPPKGEPEGPPEPVLVDAGEWEGNEFISSGLQGEIQYRLTFTEPGTYSYACLIHPQMVGSVEVR